MCVRPCPLLSGGRTQSGRQSRRLLQQNGRKKRSLCPSRERIACLSSFEDKSPFGKVTFLAGSTILQLELQASCSCCTTVVDRLFAEPLWSEVKAPLPNATLCSSFNMKMASRHDKPVVIAKLSLHFRSVFLCAFPVELETLTPGMGGKTH